MMINPHCRIGRVKPKPLNISMAKNQRPHNLVVLPEPEPRAKGSVDLTDGVIVWGRVYVEFMNTSEPLRNTDFMYALEAAKKQLMKGGFWNA